MFGTYKAQDVTILLKDISGLVEPLGTREREKLIQSGRHYSEMLPIEYEPSEKYLQAYFYALNRYSKITAAAVANVAEKIFLDKGKKIALVSLARAGTPIGILIKHYLERKFPCAVTHYTISIIRGIGIDKNAVNFILQRHKPEEIQFVDGWTGKGAIQRELNKAIEDFPEVNAGLAVLSDPAGVADKCGTHEDFLIASSCLNSTVSGLLSRTFLRNDIIGAEDFHGAAFYSELADKDLTYQFINAIEKHFDDLPEIKNSAVEMNSGLAEVKKIAADFKIADINLIKPSIGEATRVLLRRLPWKILVHSLHDEKHLGHLYQLAKEKGAPLEVYPLKNYKACGLIQRLADN
ncbi:MAG: cysteine protease StiP family protein [Selenomonadaceae bacterium]|nr:cysteine protease StiP family protein [Selenomonadaceae bacterium]